MNQQDVVMEARKWIGTRWRHQGRVLGSGVDCAGLVIGVAHAMSLTDFDFNAYGRLPDGDKLRDLCGLHMIPTGRIEIGSVVLMKFAREPQHLGIIGDYPEGGFSLIHAYAQARMCVEHRLNHVWMSRIITSYRMPGVYYG